MSPRYDENMFDDESIDMVDGSYDGHHEGYTYMGGGYYSNNNCVGSDMYVVVDEFGHKEYHASM